MVAATDVGKDEQRMPVKLPVALQFLPQAGGQRHDAILVALAVANEQFVFSALDVVDGQGQALAQAQAAGVDELDGRAIAAQADMGQQIMNLLAGEDGRQGIVIFGADLGEDGPVGVAEEVDKKLATSGQRLANGFGLPLLLEFDEEEVVAHLGLGEQRRIAAEVLVNQAQLSVVRVAGAIGVVAQAQPLGKAGHGLERMLVIDGVDEIPWSGSDGGGRWWWRGCLSRVRGLGASERLGVLEVFGMNGVWIGAFHAPPIL